MLSEIITKPIALALWGVCGAAVIVVSGIFLFVIWQAKKSTRKEEESARSSAALVDIRDENGVGGEGGRRASGNDSSEEARESPTGSRNSDTPSVFIVIPAVDDHDEDEGKYLGGDAHHILENRSSVTDIFMRLSKSHSIAEGIASPARVHKNKNLKKSLDFNSNNLTKYLDHIGSDGSNLY